MAHLYEVLLDAAGGGDHHVHHSVLHQIAHVLAHAGGDQVRREAQENLGAHAPPLRGAQARICRPRRLVAQAPRYLAHGRGQFRGQQHAEASPECWKGYVLTTNASEA